MNPNVSPEQLANIQTSDQPGNGRVWSRTFVIILVVIVLVIAFAGWFLYGVVNDNADETPAETTVESEESSFRFADY